MIEFRCVEKQTSHLPGVNFKMTISEDCSINEVMEAFERFLVAAGYSESSINKWFGG